MAGIRDILQGALNQATSQQQQNQQLNQLVQKAMIEARIKQQDPYRQLQAQLMQDFLRQRGGQQGIAGGQTTGQATNIGGVSPQGATQNGAGGPSPFINQQSLSFGPSGPTIGFNRVANPEFIPPAKARELSIKEEKFATEQEADIKLKEVKRENLLNTTKSTLKSIEEVEKGIKHFGLLGDLPSVPGSQRTIWEANVNRLLAGKVLAVMTSLKEASRTGSTGFGQLSEKELTVLRDASTTLKRNLPPRYAQGLLTDMKRVLNKILLKQSQPEKSQNVSIEQLSDKQAYQEYLKIIGGR